MLKAERETDVLNLAFWVYLHSRINPQRNALVVDDRAYTYGELGATAQQVAAWVRSASQRTDRPPRVGILAARSFETYAGLLGAAWAGTTYIPLNPRQPADRLESILRRVELDALVVDHKGAALLKDLIAVIPAKILAGPSVANAIEGATRWTELSVVATPASRRGEAARSPAGLSTLRVDRDAGVATTERGGGDARVKIDETFPPVPIGPDHPVYVIFTSGTTGVPKGVVAVAGGVAHYLGVAKALYQVTPDDRVAQNSETTFDVSVFEMYTAWEACAALYVVPENELMMPGNFIQRHELTMWSCVPSVVLTMRKANQLQPNSYPTLRSTYFVGEPLSIGTVKAWQAAAPNSVINNEYGPTETTVTCIMHRIAGEPIQTKDRGTVAIGNVYPGMIAAVRSPEGKWLGANEVGELALSGAQMSAGYMGDSEQTAKRFPTLEHPIHGKATWYLTGDFAYVDENGIFHCLGRMDNQVKILGHRIELEDVEAHLRRAAGVDAVATVAFPIVDGHATGIVAFVCGSSLEPAAIREQMRTTLPPYMVPRRVIAVDPMPLNPNGKCDRKALKRMLEEKV